MKGGLGGCSSTCDSREGCACNVFLSAFVWTVDTEADSSLLLNGVIVDFGSLVCGWASLTAETLWEIKRLPSHRDPTVGVVYLSRLRCVFQRDNGSNAPCHNSCLPKRLTNGRILYRKGPLPKSLLVLGTIISFYRFSRGPLVCVLNTRRRMLNLRCG